jgi:hypothetical protein
MKELSRKTCRIGSNPGRLKVSQLGSMAPRKGTKSASGFEICLQNQRIALVEASVDKVGVIAASPLLGHTFDEFSGAN